MFRTESAEVKVQKGAGWQMKQAEIRTYNQAKQEQMAKR